MVKKLLILVGAAAILFSLGCDGDADFVKMSQADWTAEGWTCWKRGDYDGAESAFGNALKVDPYYAEAHGGLGWTFMRMQNLEEATDQFENAILVGEQATKYVRQLIYMGAAVAYEANDDYETSAKRGRFMVNNLDGQDFEFGEDKDEHVTGYDLYVILALDYYGLGQSDNCVWAINQMRGMVSEPKTYKFTNWKNVTTEIERLIGKDPS